MKIHTSFKIGAYIKGLFNLEMSGSQTYNELFLIHRTSAVSKTLVFRWQNKFQDGFTNLTDGSRPGQPKNVATNANIAAVAGLKIMQNIAYTRDVFYVRREVDLMKTAKLNAYIMHIFGKIKLLSIYAN